MTKKELELKVEALEWGIKHFAEELKKKEESCAKSQDFRFRSGAEYMLEDVIFSFNNWIVEGSRELFEQRLEDSL